MSQHFFSCKKLISINGHNTKWNVTLARTKTTILPADKILSVLAKNREFEQYKLPKATGLSYRTILRKLGPMEKNGVIKLVRKEPSEKGGKEKKIYAITFRGLWYYLIELVAEKPYGKKQIEKIASTFPEMLLTFKKWNLFVEAKIKDQMIDVLIAGLRDRYAHFYDMLRLFSTHEIPREEMIELAEALERDTIRNLDKLVIVGSLQIPQLRDVLKQIYLKDKELMNFVLESLEKAKAEYMQTQELDAFLKKN